MRDPRLVPWVLGPFHVLLSIVETVLDPDLRAHAGAEVLTALVVGGAFVLAGWFPLLGSLLAAVAVPVALLLGVPGPGGTGLIGMQVLVAWAAFALRGRAMWAAVGAVAVSGAWTSALGGQTLSEAVFFPIAFAPSVLIGVMIARSRARERRLVELAAALDAEREATARTAVMEERTRLAREVHDAVAHSVSVMVLQLGGLRRQLDDVLTQRPAERDVLLGLERLGRQSVEEMRGLVGILRETGADDVQAPRPSLDRVDDLLTDVRAAGLPVVLTQTGDPQPLPSGLDASAYRVLQEALTNVLRHAGPAATRVELSHRPDSLVITVEDDGGTPSVPPSPGGNGLIGMRERVALFDGSLEAAPRPQGGYRVRARFPRSRGWT
jgi:signal transduction histidine kinase